jgi:predicted ABC-class ATPase
LSIKELEQLLNKIDGKGYGGYKQLRGKEIEYKEFIGRLTRVQGDPHAPPSIFEAVVPETIHSLNYPLSNPRFYKPLSDLSTRILYSKTRKYTSIDYPQYLLL